MSTIADGGLRVVSVGFIKPQEDEVVRSRDTIHICLRPWGSSIGVEVFSEENFRYDGTVVPGLRVLKKEERYQAYRSNMTHSGREGLPITTRNYDVFIRGLAKENDAQIRYHLVEDGIKLAEKLQEIHGLSGIVQP